MLHSIQLNAYVPKDNVHAMFIINIIIYNHPSLKTTWKVTSSFFCWSVILLHQKSNFKIFECFNVLTFEHQTHVKSLIYQAIMVMVILIMFTLSCFCWTELRWYVVEKYVCRNNWVLCIKWCSFSMHTHSWFLNSFFSS